MSDEQGEAQNSEIRTRKHKVTPDFSILRFRTLGSALCTSRPCLRRLPRFFPGLGLRRGGGPGLRLAGPQERSALARAALELARDRLADLGSLEHLVL